MRALRRHVFGASEVGPHSYAIALRTAIDEFRQLETGSYDHEFFWAPYVLHGLG